MNRFEQAAEEALTTRAEMARLVAKFDIRWAVDPSLRFPASEADCPPIGWAGLVEKLVHELLRRGWDRKLTEANEKLGVLRFEIDGDAAALHAAINRAIDRSAHTCGECGAPGELRDGKLIVARCDRHAAPGAPLVSMKRTGKRQVLVARSAAVPRKSKRTRASS